MADFLSREIDFSQINNGRRFEDGDGITPNAVNAPIEAAHFAQETAKKVLTLAENQPDVSRANAVGTPSVSIVKKSENEYQFAFANLKGEKGDDFSEDVNKLYETTSKNDKRISNLESKISNDAFINDTDISYQKIVPADVAPYAEIVKIGGMTYKEPVKDENLFPYPYTSVYNANEVNGKITINGEDHYAIIDTSPITLAAGEYILDIGKVENNFARVEEATEDNINFIRQENSSKFEFTLSQDTIFTGIALVFYGSAYGQSFYPLLYKKGSTVEWVDRGSHYLEHAKVTEIKSKGENIVPMPYTFTSGTQNNGIKFTYNIEGVITLNGTLNDVQFEVIIARNLSLPAGKYAFRGFGALGDKCCFVLKSYKNGSFVANIGDGFEAGRTFTIDEETARTCLFNIVIYGYVGSGYTFTNHQVKPMLVYGGTIPSDYKPFVGTLDTFSIPEAVRNREGYGFGVPAVNDYIEFKDGRVYYHQNLYKFVYTEGMSLPKYSPISGQKYRRFYFAASEIPVLQKRKIVNDTQTVNYSICDKLIAVNYYTDKVGYYFDPNGTSVYLKSPYSTVEETAQWLYGTEFILPLAEPIVTDITDLMPIDNFIKVQSDGYIIAENDYKYAVPTEILYQKRS